MKRPKMDAVREKRIEQEIIADAYDEEERAMGWYYYLVETLEFPFKATCLFPQHKSPLHKDDVVEVIGMAAEHHCLREMFVDVVWNGDQATVPLKQLSGNDMNQEIQEALDDWRYWVARGYGF